MLVIEKYAKNGSKHENGPNWAGSRVQADANEENLAMIQASDAMLNAWVGQFIVEPQPEPEPQFEPEDLEEEDFDEDPDEDPDEEDDDGPADSGDSHSTIV
ncbi:hypothetical protein E3N88_30215 [Mikania micrantha]|uniref:Uncharacterized protein n=1 Tax=Mikania micrantha TaxID=192012 RepID=A0A5N6MLR3_9ASTR|nr:hypothetical protein E3N88_30215 [Mikania micrantha]